MATFFARRYLRPPQHVGGREKAIGVLLLVLLGGVIAAYIGQAATNRENVFELDDAVTTADGPADQPAATTGLRPADQADLFPAIGLDGWGAPSTVSRFTPDNLYQKIDGRVGLYLQYHVVGLAFGTYQYGSDEQRTIDVYRYDMGEPKNARGVYQAEAPPDAERVAVGEEGYATGGAVFFRKGASYVQVLPTGPEEADGPAALEIAKTIAARIAGSQGDEWALAVLPREERIDGSFEYVAEDAFGLDFLKDVYTTEYDAQGGHLKLFVHRAGDELAAKALLDRYVAYFQEYGQVVWTDPDALRRMVAGEASGVIDVVFQKGPYVGGVAGADDLDAARRAAIEFYDGVGAGDGGKG